MAPARRCHLCPCPCLPLFVPTQFIMATTYTISDLAKEFDLTTRAMRFYEDMGLLQPQRMGPGGRNRVYTARDRTRLKLTLRANCRIDYIDRFSMEDLALSPLPVSLPAPVRARSGIGCAFGRRIRDALPGAGSAVWPGHTSESQQRSAPEAGEQNVQPIPERVLRPNSP